MPESSPVAMLRAPIAKVNKIKRGEERRERELYSVAKE
jgi:hypothetical protein